MAERISILIDEKTIDAKIREVAAQISSDYAGRAIHLICILKGSAFFACELAKRLTIPTTIDFMSVSSYGSGTSSSGIIRLVKDLDEPIEGKDVLIIEDIIDSGRTLAHLVELLSTRNPASLKLCTLLDKPERRKPGITLVPEYVGFTIPNEFVVGYGLDFNEHYRNLPYIGVLKPEAYEK